MTQAAEHLNEPVRGYARSDFAKLRQHLTVEEALALALTDILTITFYFNMAALFL
jgi:hypothetical protein